MNLRSKQFEVLFKPHYHLYNRISVNVNISQSQDLISVLNYLLS